MRRSGLRWGIPDEAYCLRGLGWGGGWMRAADREMWLSLEFVGSGMRRRSYGFSCWRNPGAWLGHVAQMIASRIIRDGNSSHPEKHEVGGGESGLLEVSMRTFVRAFERD